METERPDPDALLAEVNAAAARERRGRLKIFFGATAGVGKTFAMLTAAHDQLRAGTDVVVGLLETHGRVDTAALLDGLPQLPPLMLDVQGTQVKEFDLDGALTRRPALILVDELAHTNAPGARHPKRWQDVDELLARRHRRLHDAQRPAPRKPERRRRADHRRPRQRNAARHVLRSRRRSRADRLAARRIARAAARGQGVRAAADRARAREFLPEGQPDCAARNGAAADGRSRRCADARVPRREVDCAGMGCRRTHRRRNRGRPPGRAAHSCGEASRRRHRRPVARGVCRNAATVASASVGPHTDPRLSAAGRATRRQDERALGIRGRR